MRFIALIIFFLLFSCDKKEKSFSEDFDMIKYVDFLGNGADQITKVGRMRRRRVNFFNPIIVEMDSFYCDKRCGNIHFKGIGKTRGEFSCELLKAKYLEYRKMNILSFDKSEDIKYCTILCNEKCLKYLRNFVEVKPLDINMRYLLYVVYIGNIKNKSLDDILKNYRAFEVSGDSTYLFSLFQMEEHLID